MATTDALDLGYRYEGITNSDREAAPTLAEGILRDGWSRRGSPVVQFGEPVNWAMESEEHRSWNFYLHCLDPIDMLLAAHDRTGNLDFLRPAVTVGMDWVTSHPRGGRDISPMAWYDMAVGLRAYRLAYLYDAARAAGLLGAREDAALWQALEDHRTELADDSKIAFHNNHGYYQVAGQLALGRRFSNVSPAMAELHRQGMERLRRMLDQQFTEEGVHREHSPDYHRMVLDTLLGLIQAGLVEDRELMDRADAIQEALSWFVYPSGTIVNFGDSDSRRMLLSPAVAAGKWTTPMMQAVASGGAVGGPFPSGLRAFKASGYAVLRQPDPATPHLPERDSYLAQTAAFHSRTHKHADDLSFVWYERGQPVLVDAGRYGYIGKTSPDSELWQEGFWYSDPMRMFMESTRAHNTLEFDGRNYVRKGAQPYVSAIQQTTEVDGTFVIEGRVKQFRSIWHDRVLIIRPGKWLVVLDAFVDNLNEPHTVRQWFHFAPGTQVMAEGGGFRATLPQDGTIVQVRPILEGVLPGEVVEGQRVGELQGWWSPAERKVEPAPAVAFVQDGESRGVMATLFTLSRDAAVDMDLSRSNPTGRRVRFMWQDGQGVHRLSLDRSEVLDLNYTLSRSRSGPKPPLSAGDLPPS